jgi:pimeloyl-ACP methyl ester carboxylesterase
MVVIMNSSIKNVVLVHGGFVDGSGWERVYGILRDKGFRVSIIQNPTTSLADDLAVTKRVLDQQDGPTILVGHSYGGVVITEAEQWSGTVALIGHRPSFANMRRAPPPQGGQTPPAQ